MGGVYEQALGRLSGYRKDCLITQHQLAQLMGITQSQYSKMESGRAEIPFRMIVQLYQRGWDIDYLVTGESWLIADERIEWLRHRYSDSERREVFQLIVWAGEVCLKQYQNGMRFRERKLLKLLLYYGEEMSVLELVRRAREVSQGEMAQELGIGLRKYRALEKETAVPDFKVLCRVYELEYALPTLFLNRRRGEEVLVGRLWGQLNQEERERVWQFLKCGSSLVQKR